ncbi:uncharacterized protein [Chironomus tepperi]|uniref:uncharacterized protein n=1 Tax=Chironomus tepperi TaxID=113505 RepID=UPI00391F2EF2
MKLSIIVLILIITSTSTSDDSERIPHPYDCESFMYSYNPKQVWSCAEGLHFSPITFKCEAPAEAKCHQDYWCPKVDDPANPVYVADAVDCRSYFICSNGTPNKTSCDSDLYWDYIKHECVAEDSVTCDKRTQLNLNFDNEIEVITTATEKPKLEVCNIKKDLFDGPNYLKSVCVVSVGLAYDAAMKKCAENNMNLFIIDDETVEAQFNDAIMNLVAVNHARGTVWINGRREGQGKKWKVLNPDGTARGPLHSGVDFYSKYASGDCLKYTGTYGVYQALPGPCTDAPWPVCEHYQKTENPPKLDTSACTHKRDLKLNDSYIKSMCVISTAYTYEEATRQCSKYGMNLFIFRDKSDEKSFHKSSEDLLKTWAGGHLWINGMRDLVTNQWNVFNANRTIQGELYKDIEWVNKDAIRGKINGECLRYSGQYGPYQALGVACTEKSWIVCEYFD